MANELPPLVARLVADVTQFVAGMEKAGASTIASTNASKAAINSWNKETTAATDAVKTAFLGVGLGLGVAAVASVKMAADFQSTTTRLITSAGETTQNIAMVRAGILSMAGQVGDSAQELATAMYMVDSANIHGADSLIVLRAAAEGTKTENADLTTVVEATTSAMADYHLGAGQAAMVTTKLIAGVSMGKTTFQDLTGSLHSVLPVASAAHISLSDIIGDVASMTEHGASADQVTQNLAHTIEHLQKTTAPQNKELALLGLNAQQLSADLGTKGLSGTLIEISDAIQSHMGADGKVILDMQTALKGLPPAVQQVGESVINGTASLADFTKAAKGLNVEQAGLAHSFANLLTSTHGIGSAQKTGAQVAQTYAAALAAATGDSTTLNTALMLTGENAAYTEKAVAAVGAASTEAGGHVAGWAAIQATFNNQLDRVKDGLEAAAIAWGTKLLPMASQALGYLSSQLPTIVAVGNTLVTVALAVGRIVSALGPFLPAIAGVTAAIVAWRMAMTLGLAIQGALTAAEGIYTAVMVAATAGEEGMTAAQWLLNVAMDANPVGLVVLALAALVAIAIVVITHWQTIVHWLETAWNWTKQVASAVNNLVQQHQALAIVLGVVMGPIGVLIVAASELYTHWNQVTSAVEGAISAIGRVAGAISGAESAIKNLPALGGAAQALGIPGLAGGGLVTHPTLAMVGEAGPELVVPLRDIHNGGNAGRYAPGYGGGPQSGSGYQITINIYGATDPAATAAAVDLRLTRLLTSV